MSRKVGHALRLWTIFSPPQVGMLRTATTPLAVEEISTPAVQRLVDDMLATMVKHRGVGLAAPQVGKSIRLAVVAHDVTPDQQPLVMINPTLESLSPDVGDLEEGCLSIPGVFGIVRRSRQLVLKAMDRRGQVYSLVAEDFLARVIQHEYDHLQGRLFIDRHPTLTAGADKL